MAPLSDQSKLNVHNQKKIQADQFDFIHYDDEDDVLRNVNPMLASLDSDLNVKLFKSAFNIENNSGS